MSLQFSDTENKNGIVELIDDELGTNAQSYPLLKKARDANLALDALLAIAFKADGGWQLDDTNHTKYPIIKTTLTAGRRDYKFLTDEQGNVVLDIYRVFVKDENGTYHEIYPVDMQSDKGVESFNDGLNVQGIPSRYDKTGNSIFLDSVPSYTIADGLKVMINREGSYFVSTDTTKKPGVPGLFHEWFVLHPAYRYARRKNLKNAKTLKTDLDDMEKRITTYFTQRTRDERAVLGEEIINSM